MSEAKRLDIPELREEANAKVKETIVQVVAEYDSFVKKRFDISPTELRGRMNGFAKQIMVEFDQLLALISPLIEDARKEGYKMGVFADKGFHLTDIEDAKKQETKDIVEFLILSKANLLDVNKIIDGSYRQALSKEE